MILRFVAIFLLAGSAAARAQSSANCPWFTSGSAQKLLGGEVSVEAHVNADRDGSCRFARGAELSTPAIEITVGKTQAFVCPVGSMSLKTLGNEAMQCRRKTPDGQIADTIAGRIRDIYFVVGMFNVLNAVRPPASGSRAPDQFSASPLEKAAEQVVGNLY